MLKLETYTYRFQFWTALALYRLVLDLSYVYVLVPNFGYMGFHESLTPFSYVTSWVVFILLLPFVPEKIGRLSDFYRVIFFVSLIVPLTSFFSANTLSFYPLFVSCLAYLIFVFLTASPCLKLLPRFPVFSEGRLFTLLVSMGLVIFLIFWYQYSGAIKYINFDISKVYEFRAESAAVANVGILSYLNSWVYQVITIFLFSFFLMEKKFLSASLVFSAQVFFFAVSGHKSLLFYPFMILGIWVLFSGRQGGILIVISLFLVVLLSSIFYFLLDDVWPVSLFVRRALFVPADLTYDYFMFFFENPHVYWSNSVLSGFLPYPYDQGIAKLIGEFNGSGAAANNGFISSGFAHAGLVGVVFYSFVFSAFVLMLEKVSSALPLWFSIAVTVVPLRSAIVSSDLYTVMLTHGLLLTLIIIILFSSNKFRYK